MHTLAFLDPGHFHAALTLGDRHPRVRDELVVHAPKGPELDDFVALIDGFNHRRERPTGWRVTVHAGERSLERLVAERPGDVVVLAGRNDRKLATIRRLHDAGFHVLADKPWLVSPDDLDDVVRSLDGGPLVMEIMTGRHDPTARLLARLVAARAILGAFREETPALEQDSVHHLEKLVDGAPLRRPWWYFDVRVQGGGAVDIPTHLVDQAQWLAESTGVAAGTPLELLEARAWPTLVPLDAFTRMTGMAAVPPELASIVEPGGLRYACNAELRYRIGAVTARATARWNLAAPPGGGDTYRLVAHGTRADVGLEQDAQTGYRRRLFVECRAASSGVGEALAGALRAADGPAMVLERVGEGRFEIGLPPGADGGHETHFARVLDDLLATVDGARRPTETAERTRAKYALLAAAARATSVGPLAPA